MYNLIVKEKISPAINSDGPQGPQHVFKVGDLMLSQLTQAPLLPLAYAASRAWRSSPSAPCGLRKRPDQTCRGRVEP